MPKNKEIRIRLTSNQLDRVKMNMQAKGFTTLSGYMRYLCLEYSQFVEDRILENNKILKELVNLIRVVVKKINL